MNHIIDTHHRQYSHNYRRDYMYGHEDDHHTRPYNIHPSKSHYAVFVFRKIWMNRNLRVLLILAVVIVIILLLLALVLLLPLVGKLIDLVSQGGLKGIYESVLGFLEKLWSGK
jgi:hypothetical protein